MSYFKTQDEQFCFSTEILWWIEFFELNLVPYLLGKDGMWQMNLIGPADSFDSMMKDQPEGAFFSSSTKNHLFWAI